MLLETKANRRVSSLFVGSGLLVATFGISYSAPASELSAGATSQNSATTVQLQYVAVTKVTPIGSGNSEVVLANGSTTFIPTSVAAKLPVDRHGAANPQKIVYGNCGDSYIQIQPNSNNSGVYGFTGWSVYPTVVGTPSYYQWGAELDNTTYSRGTLYQWEDPVSSDSWMTSFNDVKGAGSYTSFVVGIYPSLTAYVYGSNGVCASAGTRSATDVP